MKKLAMAMMAAMAALGTWAAGASFAYQGVLMNEAGTAPITGNKTIELRLYNAETGGSALWGRAYNVLADLNGLFSIEVSDDAGSAIVNASLANVLAENRDKTLYIGITVTGTSGEILPRQKMLAVPYAIFAADTAKASGNFTVKGTLTAASATVSGTLQAKNVTVSGGVSGSTLTTTGDMTVGGKLNVTGTITGFGTVPIGGIIMWSGAVKDIPTGYKLCDGGNYNGWQTPNLQGRFIVGAGSSYAVGATGGADFVTLSVSQMPIHRHHYVGDDQLAGIDGGWTYAIRDTSTSYDAGSALDSSYKSHVYGTDYQGGSESHENRPPYYALCFIMRVQ